VKCKGCINIENGSFPFGGRWTTEPVPFSIDTEGCGLYDVDSKGREVGLIIHYCPVCGKKLEEIK